MAGELAVVRRLLRMDFGAWPGDALTILSEHVVLRPSSGHLYVGHDGFALWFREQARVWAEARLVPESAELLGGGWVLVRAAVVSRDRAGEAQIQPGYWLIHVEGEKVTAFLYYRTEDKARAAVGHGSDR